LNDLLSIVEGVEQIAMERVNILEAGKGLNSARKALGEGFSSVLDFSRAKIE